MRVIKNIMAYLLLFSLMGGIYYSLEVIGRGYSHWTMFLLGGFCGIVIGLLNEHILKWDTPFEYQILIGLLIVEILEFLTGYFLHYILKIQPWIWNYSNLPFNILGQVSLVFAPVFIIPIALAILLDDWYRYKIMGQEKPYYKSLILRRS